MTAQKFIGELKTTPQTNTMNKPNTQVASQSLDLKSFPWPQLMGIDMAFGTMDADKTLLAEAHRRGFGKETPYDRLFSKLFFEGGQLDFKEGLDPEFKRNATMYLRSFMGSFTPKHEHKQAISALILSELVNEPQKAGAK